MLNLSIAGRVGKDAELRVAGNSKSDVLNFSVAVSGYDFKERAKTTTWVRVAVWGKRGEQLLSLITKGSSVACSGEMSLREYNGKTYIELKAQDVTLLGSPPGERDEEPAPRQEKRSPARQAPKAAPSNDFPEDDDIPF